MVTDAYNKRIASSSNDCDKVSIHVFFKDRLEQILISISSLDIGFDRNHLRLRHHLGCER